MKTFYVILGVSRSATHEEIRQKYRHLVLMHHPDKNKTNDDSKFKEIQEAYATLSDQFKKNLYDQTLENGMNLDSVDWKMFFSSFLDYMVYILYTTLTSQTKD